MNPDLRDPGSPVVEVCRHVSQPVRVRHHKYRSLFASSRRFADLRRDNTAVRENVRLSWAGTHQAISNTALRAAANTDAAFSSTLSTPRWSVPGGSARFIEYVHAFRLLGARWSLSNLLGGLPETTASATTTLWPHVSVDDVVAARWLLLLRSIVSHSRRPRERPPQVRLTQ